MTMMTAVMIMIMRILNLEENAETEWQRDEDEKPGDGKEDPATHADAGHKVRV